jgi:uncharacterized protein (TIGR03118 family)
MNDTIGTLRKGTLSLAVLLLALAFFSSTAFAVAGYRQTNLVSDGSVPAAHTDANLVNPWGIAFSSTSYFWVSNNGTGVSTLYNGAGTPQALIVTIPTPPSTPTGLVYNGGTGFQVGPNQPARFIFATQDGTISGWNPAANPTNAIREVDNSVSGAGYKGLAIGNNGSGDFLYAANFAQGKIDVFDSTYAPVTLAGGFLDPNLSAGYAPFNVQNLGGMLYVTYALQATGGQVDDPGAGHGFVDVFDLNGNLLQRLITQGALNSPWGLALAPKNFGVFSNDLLVGNHGDGLINAFDPVNGAFLGTLSDTLGNPIKNDGLWGLIFGNDGMGGKSNILYFTAGPYNNEPRSLFGSLSPAPLPGSLVLLGSGLIGILAGFRRGNG